MRFAFQKIDRTDMQFKFQSVVFRATSQSPERHGAAVFCGWFCDCALRCSDATLCSEAPCRDNSSAAKRPVSTLALSTGATSNGLLSELLPAVLIVFERFFNGREWGADENTDATALLVLSHDAYFYWVENGTTWLVGRSFRRRFKQRSDVNLFFRAQV